MELSQSGSEESREAERRAYHEAGHAVVYYLYGIQVFRVSIEAHPYNDELEAAGIVEHEGMQGFDVDRFDEDWEVRNRVEGLIAGCYGGPVAADLKGMGGTDNTADSFHAMRRALDARKDDPIAADALLRKCLDNVRQLLRAPKHWAAVEALAHRLLEVSTLTGEEAGQVIRRALAKP